MADNKSLPRLRRGEFATFSNDILRRTSVIYGSGKNATARLYSDDALIIRRGRGDARELDIYLDLLTDESVLQAFQRQIHEVISREFFIVPGGEDTRDKELADWCYEKLLKLGSGMPDVMRGQAILNKQPGGFDLVVAALLEAVIIGYRVAEIVWERDEEGFIYPCAIIPKDSRRFLFEYDQKGHVYIKHRSPGKSWDGEFLDPKKFIVHSFYTYSNDNPHGLGLGRELYFPVQWRREAITSWLTLIDRHITPIKVGKVTEDATDEDADAFLQSMRNLAQNTSTVLPPGYEYEIVEPTLKGAETLSELIKYLDRQINKVILGEASTGEAIAGSNSRDEISNGIRVRKAKGYADQLVFTLNNTLMKWMAEYKDPKAKPPRIVWDFDDMRTMESQEIINNVATLIRDVPEYKPDLKWLEDKINIPRTKEEELEGGKKAKPSIEDLLGMQTSLLQPQTSSSPSSSSSTASNENTSSSLTSG